MKTRTLTECAVMAAVCCVLSVVSVPVGAVPVSLGVLGVLLAGMVLGAKKGSAAVAVFLLIGIIGIPVFTGFRGGIGVLLGLTGGYIWAYLPMAAIAGAAADKPAPVRIAACAAAVALCYTLGTAQFMLLSENTTLFGALAACVLPFIPFDIVKLLIAVFAGAAVRRAAGK